jgi:hypothetical protein
LDSLEVPLLLRKCAGGEILKGPLPIHLETSLSGRQSNDSVSLKMGFFGFLNNDGFLKRRFSSSENLPSSIVNDQPSEMRRSPAG